MSPREKQANRRIRLLLVVLALGFAGTLARATWLQAVTSPSLAQMADKQQVRTQRIPASRGTIFDRNGVGLAIGEQMTTVFADPKLVTSPRAVAIAAHDTLGVNANALYPQLLNKKSQFLYIARAISAKKADKLLKRKLNGVYSVPEQKRIYPLGSVGASVIGYAGLDNTGLIGLEVEYNKRLAGHAGTQTDITDPFGRVIDPISTVPESQGQDIFTTLDQRIQANAEQVLRETISKWDAQSATAVVLDPSTGAILAMAQAPGYNANSSGSASQSLEDNIATSDVYEPGSVFKVVTIAGALSQGLVTPRTQFTLPYAFHYADCCTVHDAELRGTETLSVSQILAQSSNVGVVTVAKLLGQDGLAKWVDDFGFGKQTGVDFPGEAAGLVPSRDEYTDATIGNVPIGQGIAVTPLQVAAVYGAIANGGVWNQPHLVTRVGGKTLGPWKHRRIVSESVAETLKQMFGGVVTDVSGTGTAAAIPGYTVAGKTGTAQIPDGHGGYSKYNYNATFVGMVPASHPKLVVLVMVHEPRNSIFGGVVAAPAFASIAKFDLQYLGIPPDDPSSLTSSSG